MALDQKKNRRGPVSGTFPTHLISLNFVTVLISPLLWHIKFCTSWSCSFLYPYYYYYYHHHHHHHLSFMQGIYTYIPQTMSLGNTVLQIFCCYYSWCLYRQFQCWIYCTFTLVLSEVCVQCPIWLFSVVPWLHVFLVCCSRIFWMTLK